MLLLVKQVRSHGRLNCEEFKVKGLFIFYEVGGAGGFCGAHRKKKNGLEGGAI